MRSVRVVDHGANKLLEASKELKRQRRVDVGVIGNEAAAVHIGSITDKSDGETVAEIATKHEFGIDVPRRSFIRDYVDQNLPQLQLALRRAIEKVTKGELSADDALELLALKMQGGIQERITQGINPPNAQSTIDRKGSSKPLIDRGQLLQSITTRVI